MTGSEVFKFATRTVVESCEKVLERRGHRRRGRRSLRARTRPTSASSSRPPGASASREGQVFANLDRYGNTSCASIPICLHEASEKGRLKKGDTLLMVGFGAGLTWGSCLTKWEL